MTRFSATRAASRRAVFALGCVALTVVALTRPAGGAPARYTIDPEHLVVAFLVDHIGYAKVLGMFRKASGEFTFDEATGTLSALRVEVETASVDTNHRKRDQHLRSPDFLNSGEFPTMVFTADGATRTDAGTFVIDGTLELIGDERPLRLEATLNKAAEYPIGRGKPWVIGISARGAFERAPYGMTYGVDNGWVGNRVELIIELEARRE